VIVIIVVSVIDGTDGTGDKIVVGGTIGIDSTTDCIEHDSRGDCIDCGGGAGGRGCYPRREGGLIIPGWTAPPALTILCPSLSLHFGGATLDASRNPTALTIVGVRTCNLQATVIEFPPSM
jgi:hypothetical protein